MIYAAAQIAVLDAPWRPAPGKPGPIYDRIAQAAAARGPAPMPLRIGGVPDWPTPASASPSEARIIAAALNRVVRHPDADAAAHLYNLLTTAPAIDIADQLLPRIAEESAAHRPAISALARRLAREAPDAAPVQIAIALIGVFGDAVDEDLLLTLGQAEAFALFAAVALGNLIEVPDQAIWRLAQRVHGWGRIETIGRLQHTDDPRIKDWLLRQGFRNAISHAHLALVCAQAGGLQQALAAPSIDPAALGDYADLIRALTVEAHLGAYTDAPSVIALYLAHVAAQPARDLRHVLAIKALAGLASDSRFTWHAAERFELRTKAMAELTRPSWKALAVAGAPLAEEALAALPS